MKPFDLQKAIAGEPVVTMDGVIGKVETSFTVKAGKRLIVTFQDSEDYGIYHDNGIPINSPYVSYLFMAEKPKVKKEGWIAIWRQSNNRYIAECSCVYKTKEDVEEMNFFGVISIQKIEWEEEA